MQDVKNNYLVVQHVQHTIATNTLVKSLTEVPLVLGLTFHLISRSIVPSLRETVL